MSLIRIIAGILFKYYDTLLFLARAANKDSSQMKQNKKNTLHFVLGVPYCSLYKSVKWVVWPFNIAGVVNLTLQLSACPRHYILNGMNCAQQQQHHHHAKTKPNTMYIPTYGTKDVPTSDPKPEMAQDITIDAKNAIPAISPLCCPSL